MKVFAVFRESQSGIVKVWAASWRAHGWTPQLLAEWEVEDSGSARRAAKARGGGLLVDVCVINFAYPDRRRPTRRLARVGRSGWLTAPLVRFPPGTTEQTIRDCGRALP